MELTLKKQSIFVRNIAVLLLLSLVASVFVGCKNQGAANGKTEKNSVVFYDFFDTVSEISDYSGKGKESFNAAVKMVESLLDYYHRAFDIYHEYDGMNNIATINRKAGVEPVRVDRAIIEFLEYSREIHDLTGGNVNIAMGSVLSIWHKYREIGAEIPPMSALTEANLHTDITKMVINFEDSTVYLADAKMSLDVGAIAKGYACQKFAEQLEAAGYSSYVLDLGGNLKAIGKKPDGTSWRTAVKNPDIASSEPYIYYFDIADTSVVTSGDYQRYYTVNGVRYHHIINKDTLMPADYFSSVTIITKDSSLADGLSTALFNMDYDSGLALATSIGGIAVVWVTKDGQVKTFGI